MPAVIAVISAVAALTACSSGGSATATAKIIPVRIVQAPKGLLAAASPQPDGTMWTLADTASTGLYDIETSNGKLGGSVSVSGSARSMAESAGGVIGLALGTASSGALTLLDGHTGKVLRTVPLPAPAQQVTVGNDGTTFYVLTTWAASASVAIVNAQTGKIKSSVPVPADSVSIAPDARQALLYVLQKDGMVSEVGIGDGRLAASFKVGAGGRSLALSPDGSTLYVLKGTGNVANIAVVEASTESVRRVLPAPSNCLEVLVSASGTRLYEVVGAPGYGNIQVFAV